MALGQWTQANFLAATKGNGPVGITYEQASALNGQTVQTSLTTRLDGLSSAGDMPIIGDAGYGRGAVCEGGSTNALAGRVTSTRDLTSAGWFNSLTAVSYINAANAAGPNAAGNYDESRIIAPGSASVRGESGAGGYVAAGRTSCASLWLASPANASASGIAAVYGNGTFSNAVLYAVASAIQPWQRGTLKVIEDGTKELFYVVNTFAGNPMDLLVDACQVDTMGFACEYKPGVGAAAVRLHDNYKYANGAAISAASGEMGVWLKFIPKGSTDPTEIPPPGTADTYTFFTFFNGFVRINLTSLKVEMQVNGGATQTSTNAIAFSRGDIVQFYVRFGNSKSTIMKYKIGSGAWVDLAMATSFAAVATNGDLRIFGSGGGANNFWCWIQDSATYLPGKNPQGVV